MIARHDQVPPAVIYTPSSPKHDSGGEGYALMSFLNLPYYRGSILDMIRQLGSAERGIHKPGSVSRKQDSADPRLIRVIMQVRFPIHFVIGLR